MRKAWCLLFAVIFIGILPACGDGELGDSCDEAGKVKGECEEGLVCGKKSDSSSDLSCLKQCSAQSDCGSSEDCNGVAGSSLKGCRPKPGA